MFLNEEQLIELTGYRRWADQRRWLLKREWRFEVAASGRPVVLRAYADSRLGAIVEIKRQFTPNFDSLRSR